MVEPGLFHRWQPVYAEAGIATFPVRDKKPAVSHYLKAGLRASGMFRSKPAFANDDAFGFACRPSRITVLDVDAPDEKLLADALNEFGPSPFIVRSGSGNFQAWYRHGGERRRVRPDPSRPIDILGDGFVVAPPSRSAKGGYEIIQGGLHDLARLPRMKPPVIDLPHSGESPRATIVHPQIEDEPGADTISAAPLGEGDGRNQTLFRRMVRAGHQAQSQEELIKMASHANAQFAIPLPGDEVARVAASVWKYKESGRLFTPGGEATAVVFHSDMEHLWDAPMALNLLVRLRMAHGWRNGRPFALAKETAEALGVSVPTYRAARDVLVDRHFLEIIHPGGRGKNDPPQARLL